MPDDTALMTFDMRLCGLDTEILMHPWQLLDAAIKQHKVMQQLKTLRQFADYCSK